MTEQKGARVITRDEVAAIEGDEKAKALLNNWLGVGKIYYHPEFSAIALVTPGVGVLAALGLDNGVLELGGPEQVPQTKQADEGLLTLVRTICRWTAGEEKAVDETKS